MECTLAIIKPHAIKIPLIMKRIHEIIIKEEFQIVKSKLHHLKLSEAQSFYEEHKDKFYYKRLVTYMCSGPIWLYILARFNAIDHWRKLIGPTHVYYAQYNEPNSIRGSFGLTDTCNTIHGSDSIQSARKEIDFFFPEIDLSSLCRENLFVK